MRKIRLLSTAAAIVLIGTAAASAQGMKQDEAPARAPAEKIAPAMKPGENKAGDRKAPETTGQAPKASDPDRASAPDKGSKNNGAIDKTLDKGAATKSPTDANGSVDVKSKTDKNAAQDAAGSKANPSATTETKSNTTGQGAASGSAKLSTEQRSKITTIIKQKKVQPVHLNVSIRVGTRITQNVRYYPLPAEVIVIYPEWRGYDYILVGDEIIVVDPRTHEIVAILEA